MWLLSTLRLPQSRSRSCSIQTSSPNNARVATVTITVVVDRQRLVRDARTSGQGVIPHTFIPFHLDTAPNSPGANDSSRWMLPSAMMPPIVIERIRKDVAPPDLDGLVDLLFDAIDDNAGVSFMPGLTRHEAEAWWKSVVAPDRAIVLVARDDDGIVGTVQIQPSWSPNQPHRGDVAKLIVHRHARRRGIGRTLMEALEQ